MAEIKVVANFDEKTYELNSVGESNFAREIAAPDRSVDVMISATDDSGNVSSAIEFLGVNMEWLPPKIDWTKDDYFNAVDYNRIVGNIAYLRNYAKKIFMGISEIEKREEKDYTSMIYAREINAIEDDIESINKETYLLSIGDKKTYKANSKVPDYNEYNRIEGACLRIYNELKCHKVNLPRFSFRLGNNMRFGGI